MRDLAVLIPTRGRPGNVRKVIAAWDFTNAWDHADMVLVIDADDPEHQGYLDIAAEFRDKVTVWTEDIWRPMVHKLNAAAAGMAAGWFALGFAGDDHLPQTIGWAERYLTVLRELKTGMVYGDDGYQGLNLSTEWVVTSDAVRVLGRMVPAPVEHMYCDNSIMELFASAGALRHLPEVRIEHMHPITGKAETDAQYQRVNHRDQFKKDKASYDAWRAKGMASDIRDIRALRPGLPDIRPDRTVKRLSLGSGPRPVDLNAKRTGGRTMGRNYPFPRHFKLVTGATPDEIALTLADFAIGVPADQEIVELGVYQGRTALIMSWGARQGNGAHLTAIDPWDLEGNVYSPPFTDEGSRANARYNVQALGYANHIRLIQAFSHEVAEVWSTTERVNSAGGRPVGLLFVDGDHTYEGARRDIVAWAPHLAPGARIAVDDYGHPDWPGVGQAVDALVAEGFLAPIEVFHDRLAVTRLVEKDGAGVPATSRVTAITGEGVSPSPYPAMGDQVAATADLGTPPLTVGVPETWTPEPVPVERDEVDLMFDGPDTPVSTDRITQRIVVQAGELEGITTGTPIGDLNLVHLKALAKRRGIVLGARKDKRDLILAAIRDGK